jgi:hypothetical protein
MIAYGSKKTHAETGRLSAPNTAHAACGKLNRGRGVAKAHTRAARKRARRFNPAD